eukprot:4427930-Amphidinium_carterae.1
MALEFGEQSEEAGQACEVEAPSSTEASVEASEENHSETELRRHTRYGTVHRLQGVDARTFICGRQCGAAGLYEPVALAELLSAKCCMKCFP